MSVGGASTSDEDDEDVRVALLFLWDLFLLLVHLNLLGEVEDNLDKGDLW